MRTGISVLVLATTIVVNAASAAELKLISWRCTKEHSFVFVRGEVKNISSNKIDNAIVIGIFRTSSGELVKKAQALLDYNPIMPNQTSPFEAGTSDNPEIKQCDVSFKRLLGGQISVTE